MFWQALALYPVAVLVSRLYQFNNNMLGVFALIIPTILLIKLKGQQLQIERYKERLEQLRWLENGYRIYVKETEQESVSIDSPEDIERLLT